MPHTTSQLYGGVWLPGRQTHRLTFKPPLSIESNWARPRSNETGALGLLGHAVRWNPKWVQAGGFLLNLPERHFMQEANLWKEQENLRP